METKQPILYDNDENNQVCFGELTRFLRDTKKIDLLLIDQVELWENIIFCKFTRNDNKKGQTFISYKVIGGKPTSLINIEKEKINSKSIYILERPVRGKKTKKADISASLTEIEELKENLKKEFEKKGFHSWVRKLKVIKYDLTKPGDREQAIQLANDLQGKANTLDMMKQGSVKAGMAQNTLERWADVIQKKIKENS